MATFEPRKTAPATSNRFYYTDNIFYQSDYGLPNCTCYAWGRFYELSGAYPALCTRNAENWYAYDDGYQRGKTPKLGAIIVWSKGVIGNADDGAGHVAVVEEIYQDGSFLTSNSAYGGSLFYTKVIGADCALSGYKFEGFIYNPVDFYTESHDYITGNRYLTLKEMQINARYIYQYLRPRGWTTNAIAGMLGNMETESTINPGIWQGLKAGVGPAFGLVQWDPFTKYTDWCAAQQIDASALPSALKRIEYELANGIQYYPTPSYPESFAEFKVSTKPAKYLGMAFLCNYERPKNQNQPARGTQAEYWYNWLKKYGDASGGGCNGSTRRRALPLWLLVQASKRKV